MPVLDNLSGKYQHYPSLMLDCVRNWNKLDQFFFERSNIIDKDYLWRTRIKQNPAVGKAIIESMTLTDYEKKQIVLEKLGLESTLSVIIGKRGAGKSALAFDIMEQVHKEYDKPVCLAGYYIPELPDWIIQIKDTRDAPPNSLIVIDESAIKLSARRAMSNINVNETINMAISRHSNFSVLYITQHSKLIELNIMRMADLFMIKSMTWEELAGQDYTRRRALSPLVDFMTLMSPRGGDWISETLFLHDSGQRFIFENNLPEWYTEDISKPFRRISRVGCVDLIVQMRDRGFNPKDIQKYLNIKGQEFDLLEIRDIYKAPEKSKKLILESI